MRGQVAKSLAVVAATVLLAGCATSPSVVETDECLTGMRTRLDGSWYLGSGDIHSIPSYRDSLGMATVPPCGGEAGFSFEAFSIVGVRPEVAFASPRYEDLIFIAEGTHAALPWLERLRREPTCAEQDQPITLEGPWLGILGPRHETEIDLVPPYNLSMRVDESSPSGYERTFLTIHVGRDAGRPLTRRDVEVSLQQGGSLSVTAICRDHDFWAEDLAALPPA
jgi:hypothetical protein